MKHKIRTFIAIELPGYIRNDLRKLQHVFTSHRLSIRWVKPLNMHLTISFLGDLEPSTVELVGRVLSETVVRYPIFELTPRGVGVFPSIRRPRIIWTGLAGQTDILGLLQNAVENALEPLGFAVGKHAYRGHLTLGRIKSRIDPKKLAQALRDHQEFVSQSFAVKRLVINKSELHPGGPVYTKLYEAALPAME